MIKRHIKEFIAICSSSWNKLFISTNDFKVILCTPFKVGSNSMLRILQCNYSFSWIWTNSGKEKVDKKYHQKKRFILRNHVTQLEPILVDKDLKFDCWITIIRKPYEIYPSGYFQDITTPDYPYYFGNKQRVNQASTQVLLNHFLSFDWSTFNQTNYHYNFEKILQFTGVNIWEKDFNKLKGFSVYPSKKSNVKRVGVIRFDKLNDRDTLLEFFREIKIISSRNAIVIKKNNLSHHKFYYSQYERLLAQLPQSYYDTYKDINDNIVKNFFYENK